MEPLGLQLAVLKKRSAMADESRGEGNAGGGGPFGEAAIIAGYMAPLAAGFAGALGLKDDCAFLTPPPGQTLVLKTDAVAEGIHFLASDDPFDIGWKALAVNVSDLAAKGARPIVYLMSLSFPRMPTGDWLARFTAGLASAQSGFGIHLAGGDTDKRPGPITVTISVVGAVPAGRIVQRAGARDGDRLLVSGTLGDAALGLMIEQNPALIAQWGLKLEEAAHLIDRYRHPAPRLGLRSALLEHAHAAMDLSDGLAKDLGRMCEASGLRAEVEIARLPLSGPARKALAADPSLLAAIISGGDDYEVLATASPDLVAGFTTVAAEGGIAVTDIGRMQSGDAVRFIDAGGKEVTLSRTGWDHFG
jgi:thiamine-monophosphate kinase